MKKLIITLAIIFITISYVHSQNIQSNESFIHNISLGAGLGAQILAQDFSPLMSNSSFLVNFEIQYKINKDFSVNLNTALKDNPGFEISYSTIGAKYTYLDYKNTLLPYIGLDFGAYFYDDYKVIYDVWTEYAGRKALFGGSFGTGLDLKMSKLATLDLNVKLHSFELGRSNSTYFVTVLSNLRFNL